MFHILKFIGAWLDRSGGALLIGFLFGAFTVFAARLRQQKSDRCYQREWIEAYRDEARLAKIVFNENKKCAAQLIEEDRRKHPPTK